MTLHDRGALTNDVAASDVGDKQFDQVAASELGVEGDDEHRQGLNRPE